MKDLDTLLPRGGASLMTIPSLDLERYLDHINKLSHLNLTSMSLIEEHDAVIQLLSRSIIDTMKMFRKLDNTRKNTPQYLYHLSNAISLEKHDAAITLIDSITYNDLLDIRNHLRKIFVESHYQLNNLLSEALLMNNHEEPCSTDYEVGRDAPGETIDRTNQIIHSYKTWVNIFSKNEWQVLDNNNGNLEVFINHWKNQEYTLATTYLRDLGKHQRAKIKVFIHTHQTRFENEIDTLIKLLFETNLVVKSFPELIGKHSVDGRASIQQQIRNLTCSTSANDANFALTNQWLNQHYPSISSIQHTSSCQGEPYKEYENGTKGLDSVISSITTKGLNNYITCIYNFLMRSNTLFFTSRIAVFESFTQNLLNRIYLLMNCMSRIKNCSEIDILIEKTAEHISVLNNQKIIFKQLRIDTQHTEHPTPIAVHRLLRKETECISIMSAIQCLVVNTMKQKKLSVIPRKKQDEISRLISTSFFSPQDRELDIKTSLTQKKTKISHAIKATRAIGV